MEYLTTTELSKLWNLSSRRIGVLCTEGRIDGAIKKGKMWLIPINAEKPSDARYKANKVKKSRIVVRKI
jgi:D-Tyr-tRNAtyr deacylase